MDDLRLGASGLKVPRLCLGTMTYGTPAWRPGVLDEATSRPFYQREVEHDISFFDTADMYGRGQSEAVRGRALKELARRESLPRGRARDISAVRGRGHWRDSLEKAGSWLR